MATSSPWGNPAVQTFRKKFIRRISVGEGEVFVHSAIVDIVTELLNIAVDRGTQLPKELRGWVAPIGVSEDELLPAHYGVEIDAFPGVDYEMWGFTVKGDTAVFTAPFEEAKKLSEAAEASRMMRAVDNEPESKANAHWQSLRPGKRELRVGDVGDDVMFLQLVFDVEATGTFDKHLETGVKILQRKWGQEETGIVDETVWRIILPSMWTDCSNGDNGLPVRVLQALLISYDWDYGITVSGRFDDWTAKAVREMQDTVGLRVTGHVRAPEWAYLLGNFPN